MRLCLKFTLTGESKRHTGVAKTLSRESPKDSLSQTLSLNETIFQGDFFYSRSSHNPIQHCSTYSHGRVEGTLSQWDFLSMRHTLSTKHYLSKKLFLIRNLAQRHSLSTTLSFKNTLTQESQRDSLKVSLSESISLKGTVSQWHTLSLRLSLSLIKDSHWRLSSQTLIKDSLCLLLKTLVTDTMSLKTLIVSY